LFSGCANSPDDLDAGSRLKSTAFGLDFDVNVLVGVDELLKAVQVQDQVEVQTQVSATMPNFS
jgi:hypothetical protein